MELGIMEYIHEVCQKIGAKYFLAYGSLIGAVRHKGFIPWDDDMDICMLRDDYEKLQDYLIAHQMNDMNSCLIKIISIMFILL